MKRILVTGGAGFLGANLCHKLLAEDGKASVVCLDNFYTGNRNNVADLLGNPRFVLFEHDVIEPLPQNLAVDEIYHLACPASPPHYQKDPIYTTKVNVLGMLNVLELAKNRGAKLLHTSTSEVYGDAEVHPQGEAYRGNVSCTGIRSCYDEGKRCAESLVFDYRRVHGVRAKVVRIFNTYGPKMNPQDGRVVSNFIMQGLRGEELTVYGDGSQTRSLCYVDDLLEGIVRMMASPEDFSGPVNLGNPEEHTVKEIAELVLELTGRKSALGYRPLPKDDPRRRQPDIRLAREKLGWEPKIGVRQGLQMTVEHFSRMA